MPPVSRMIEVSVYSLLNFLPFLALAIYPFRASLRFSKPVTGVLIGFLTLVQLFLIRYSHITHHGKQTVIHAQYHKPYRAVDQTENAVICGIGNIQRQRACGVQHYSETLALREQADKFFQPESVFFQFIRLPLRN